VRDALFERLLAEHERDVLRVCRSVLRDEHLGRDAAQETFVKLLDAVRFGAAPERWAAWLRRAAVTCALDLGRRRAARPQTALASEPADPSDACDPALGAARHELADGLDRAVATLPEGQRTVFLLRHAGGYTLSEVADALDLALPTVKTHFARAALRLQHALVAFRTETEDQE
jgi:RNA polymerase sigma-70 factor (ECF subfamily)